MDAQETTCLAYPATGFAVAVTRMSSLPGARPAQIVHGGTQGVNQFIEGCIDRQIAAAGIEPTAGPAKMTGDAAAIVTLIIAAKVAVGEVDISLNGPARILE